MKKNSTVLLVVAAALTDDENRILMQRRRLEGEHGGLWEFPGGKVEAGESPESALVREIEEELGISLAAESLHPAAFASGTSSPAGPEEGLVILLYKCSSWSGRPQCLEGEEIRWFPVQELARLEMPPLDYPLARKLAATLRNDEAI